MRAALVLSLLSVSMACGRSEPYAYTYDQARFDAGTDAGEPDGGEPDAGFVPCVPGRVVLKRATPVVMFVLDKSNSMGESFGGTGTRWKALVDGLSTTLPAIDQSVELGALLFPSGTVNSCRAPGTAQLAPAKGNVSRLVTLLKQNGPSGSTPTADAIDVGAKTLRSIRTAGSARAMVLATDGAPSCNDLLKAPCTCVSGGSSCSGARCLDDVRTVSRIKGHFDNGIPTYVIGIQNASDTTLVGVLNAMALAGGRPQPGMQRYFAANSTAQLNQALTTIRDQVGACVFLTTSVPDPDGQIEIRFDGNVLAEDPSGTAGWSWADRTNGEVRFQGATCTSVAPQSMPNLIAEVRCGGPDGGTADAGN